MGKEYLQVKKAADEFGVSKQSIHAWIDADKLNTEIVADRRLIVRDAKYKALLKARRV